MSWDPIVIVIQSISELIQSEIVSVCNWLSKWRSVRVREYGDSLRGSMRVRGEIAYRGEMYHPLLRIFAPELQNFAIDFSWTSTPRRRCWVSYPILKDGLTHRQSKEISCLKDAQIFFTWEMDRLNSDISPFSQVIKEPKPDHLRT